jgi:chemotaxis receptor (MCP) glutamine deamidase CheD
MFSKDQVHNLDKRISRVINKIFGGQKLIKTYIHSPIKNGGLGIPLAIQEMNAYLIHHVARLFFNREGRKIMKEYVNLEGSRIPQYS